MGTKRKSHRQSGVDRVLVGYEPRCRHDKRRYRQVVEAVRTHSRLFDEQHLNNSGLRLERLAQGLSRLAREPRVRPLEKWRPTGDSASGQLLSLLSHLVVQYPVPEFMQNIWLRDHSNWEEDLYFHMAQGKGIRQFPSGNRLELTRPAAAWFLKALANSTPLEAMRWGQVRGLGGEESLAAWISENAYLGQKTSDEPFWESVMRFLVKNWPLTRGEVWGVVQFVQYQRFEPGDITWGPGAGAHPLQPGFSLKGRTLKSLRHYMETWREHVVRQRPDLAEITQQWEPSGIEPLEVEFEEGVWFTRELLNSQDLVLEGVAMNHCVASYAGECVEGESSIWSVRIRERNRCRRLATIEIDPKSRAVVQAQAHSNNDLSADSLAFLGLWLEEAGLVSDLD